MNIQLTPYEAQLILYALEDAQEKHNQKFKQYLNEQNAEKISLYQQRISTIRNLHHKFKTFLVEVI